MNKRHLMSALCITFCCTLCLPATNKYRLAEEFRTPPRENHPAVWWWFNMEAPEEAITRDLEALSRVGISAFHIYNQNGYATDSLWRKKVKWVLHEAHRLDLDCIVCIGCAGCGHPDTSIESARKDIASSKAEAQGGDTIRLTLPKASPKYAKTLPDGTPEYYWDIACLAVPEAGKASDVVDVSAFLDTDTGGFVWPDAPEGHWDICRIGYSVNGFIKSGYDGCFIDHLRREAFDEHFSHVMLPLLNVVTPEERAALKGVMCDSWECGSSGWTQEFPGEFMRRRGYDITPWLPVLAGIRVGSEEQSSAFRHDYQLTVSELLACNHYEYQKEVAHRYGLISIAEAAGPHQWQGDVRMMQGKCDVSMGEFWMPSPHRPADPQRFMLRDAATAAHIYGIKEVLCESFTTINTYWTEYPATMKPVSDRAFCDGLTRVCYHGMMLSASLTDKPGFIRNVGTHYNPQTTWFEQSSAFNTYLSRCSRMLSEGLFHADCLVYAGDGTRLFSAMKTPSEVLGQGYDYDYCPTEVLMEARVEKGETVIPSGIRYKVIKLSERNPETAWNMKPGKFEMKEFEPYSYPMTEKVVLKLLSLVRDGAVLLGDRPEGPCSINDSVERFTQVADELWSFEGAYHKVGKGYVFRDREALLEWMAKRGAGKDFSAVGTDAKIDWIHRTRKGGDIYFVSNQSSGEISFTAQFRVKARRASLWNPVTGEISGVNCLRKRDGYSSMELSLPPYGSTFVVFNRGRIPGHSKVLTVIGSAVPESWKLSFDPKWGGPQDTLTLKELRDWTSFSEQGIRYYSGTASYSTVFNAPEGCKSVSVSLGRTDVIAEVSVNGLDCGIAWTEPYEVLSDNVRPGENTLEIRVTNLWPNRLIMDSSLPDEAKLTHTNISPYSPDDQPLPSGLIGPVNLTFHR